MNKLCLLTAFILCLLVDALASPSNPVFGDATFFTDVKAWMIARSEVMFRRGNHSNQLIVFDADALKMKTYMTSTTGDTIYDAASANPDAEIIINGSIFNYAPPKATVIPTFFPVGMVVRDGSVLSSTVGTPSDTPAVQRYWLGQTNDTSSAMNAGSAASYFFGGKGHPSPIGSGPTEIGNAHGGLFSLIWEKSGSTHKQTEKDDSDLSVYFSMLGRMRGYGIVGVDRDTNLIIIVIKHNWTNGNVKTIQDRLFNSGTDRAIMVDGAGSVGLYVKSAKFYIAARRHDHPSKEDTVPSYILFVPNE